MKRVLSLVFTVIIVVGIITSVPIKVSAASIDDLIFTLNDNGTSYSITGSKKSISGDLSIPSVYQDLPVTKISKNAFKSRKQLSSVIIPDSVVEIGAYAFAYCYDLSEVNIPDSVTKIGTYAFYDTDITRIVIPQGVTAIESSTFAWCNNLCSVKLPNSVKSIGAYAFGASSMLTSITLPSNLVSIGNEAFRGCSGITSITIPEKVKSIGKYAFYGCNFKSIKFPNSVKTIGQGALFDCKAVTSVTIGSGVEKIGNDVFANCKNLLKINVSSDNKNFVSASGILFNKAKTLLIQYPEARKNTSYSIPKTVTKISNSAFANCDNLTSVVIPDSVTSLGQNVFCDCDNLSSVTLSNSLKTIPFWAFSRCIKLKSIVIPKSVTRINEGAFMQCEKLSKITIKGTLSHIERYALMGTAYYNNKNNWQSKALYLDNYLIIADYQATGLFKIKANTKTIADYAFSNCYGITSVNIPNTVKYIGCNAFYFCNKLTSILIPESVKSIRNYAFYGCEALNLVCYSGTKKQWKEVSVGDYNEPLAKATMCYETTCLHKVSSWIIDKKATVNSAGKKHKECTKCGRVILTKKIAQLKCSKPVFKSIVNTQSGVKITWGKVNGADSYVIYRKLKDGSYTKLVSTSKTYFTDKKAKSGNQYYYIVKAVNEAGASDASKAKSIYCLADPTLSSVKSTKNGVALTWTKVTGAQGYYIYYKSGSGDYKKLVTVKGQAVNTYIHKKAQKGKTYTYKVRAYYDTTNSAFSNEVQVKDKY